MMLRRIFSCALVAAVLLGPLTSFAGQAAPPTAPTAAAGELPPPPPPADVGAPVEFEEELTFWEMIEEFFTDPEVIDVLRRVGIGLGIFIFGWILAKLLAWTVFRLLKRTDLDERIADKLGIRERLEGKGDTYDEHGTERFASKIVFFILMLFVIIAVLQFAGLTQVADPIKSFVDTVGQALPQIGKAILILVLAYFIGKLLSKVVSASLDRAGLDRRFMEMARTPADEKAEAEAQAAAEEAAEEDEKPAEVVSKHRPFGENVGRIIFWLVMVVGLAGGLDALEIEALSEPLSNAIDKIVGYAPNVGVAFLILLGGYVIAKIARAIVQNLLESFGFDRLIEKLKADKVLGDSTASGVVAFIVYVLILIQTVVISLERLDLKALSDPLTNMMEQFWTLLPSIALGVLFMIVAVLVARVIRSLMEKLLANVGFDKLMDRLGFTRLLEREERTIKPSEAVGMVVQIAVVLVAVAQVLQNLMLETWAGYVDTFLEYTLQNIIVALVIIGVGFVVGNYVHDVITSRRDERDGGRKWLGNMARYGVLVFAFTMAIHQLDVAQDFVLISFALLFGGLCLAAALAFGLGSREVAGQIVEKQYEKARETLGDNGDDQADGKKGAKK